MGLADVDPPLPQRQRLHGPPPGLEGYVAANPKSASSRFVLAYQYITGGHLDAALDQLRERHPVATQGYRRDPVAPAVAGSDSRNARSCRNRTGAAPAAAGTTPSAGIATSSSPVKEGNLAGTWTAEPSAEHNDSPDPGRRRPLHLESHEPGEVSRISGGRNLREWNPDAGSIRPGRPAAYGRPGDLAR